MSELVEIFAGSRDDIAVNVEIVVESILPSEVPIRLAAPLAPRGIFAIRSHKPKTFDPVFILPHPTLTVLAGGLRPSLWLVLVQPLYRHAAQ